MEALRFIYEHWILTGFFLVLIMFIVSELPRPR
jgi:hypothetical protein